MADGVDPKAFAERLKVATPAERARLIAQYKAWIFRGARAQSPYNFGVVLVAASAGAGLAIIKFPNTGWLYVSCAALAIVGVALTAIAWRRERDWRRSNPFRYEDDDA